MVGVGALLDDAEHAELAVEHRGRVPRVRQEVPLADERERVPRDAAAEHRVPDRGADAEADARADARADAAAYPGPDAGADAGADAGSARPVFRVIVYCASLG